MSDDRWIACLAAGGGSKRRYQYCSDYLGSIIYLRALQGHSGGNLIDLTLQDNVLIGPGIFPYLFHVGSNFNLYSIISNGLIPGGQNLSRRNPVRTSYGYQDPGKSVASDDRSGKLEKPSQPGYSQEDYGQSWSSQEWKGGAVEHDRPGQPDKTSWGKLQKVAPHRENFFSTEVRIPQGTER